MQDSDKKNNILQDNKDDILNGLDPYLKKKYESELAHIFEDLEKDDDLGAAVDQIFEETNDLDEIQSKLILVIKEHLKIAKKNGKKTKGGVDADVSKVSKDITEFCLTIMQDLDEELDPTLGKVSRKDRAHLLNVEAKKNIKRIMKNFVVYEVYKVMNPKRIAGETVKENYQNNLIEGGQKLAEKYEGGKESDLKSYGSVEVSRMQQQATAFRRGGGGGMER